MTSIDLNLWLLWQMNGMTLNSDELLITLVHLHLAYHSVLYSTMQDIAL